MIAQWLCHCPSSCGASIGEFSDYGAGNKNVFVDTDAPQSTSKSWRIGTLVHSACHESSRRVTNGGFIINKG